MKAVSIDVEGAQSRGRKCVVVRSQTQACEDDLIPTSLEIGTKPLDLTRLGRK